MYLYICAAFNTIPYIYVFFLIETPFYHYKNKDVKELYNCLMSICRQNFKAEEIPEKKMEIKKALGIVLENEELNEMEKEIIESEEDIEEKVKSDLQSEIDE
jgi:hypothetical protein